MLTPVNRNGVPSRTSSVPCALTKPAGGTAPPDADCPAYSTLAVTTANRPSLTPIVGALRNLTNTRIYCRPDTRWRSRATRRHSSAFQGSVRHCIHDRDCSDVYTYAAQTSTLCCDVGAPRQAAGLPLRPSASGARALPEGDGLCVPRIVRLHALPIHPGR